MPVLNIAVYIPLMVFTTFIVLGTIAIIVGKVMMSRVDNRRWGKLRP